MLWTSLVHDSGVVCKIKTTIEIKQKNLIIDIITFIIFKQNWSKNTRYWLSQNVYQ